jgi:formylglycine-generating enzyme required for sulfatase activity
LESDLRVKVAEDIRQLRAARAGFSLSGVARNNRLLERHPSSYGAYWKSYDFKSNDGKSNLFQNPLGPRFQDNPFANRAFEHAGGEIIFTLPNGLQGYLLVDAGGRRLDKGPLDLVWDKANPRDGGAVVNGISCMSCHVKGVIEKEDQVREYVLKNPRFFRPDETAAVEDLYPAREKFKALLARDAERFAAAVKETGAPLGATDPIVGLAWRYEWELDLSLAAASAGVRAEEFLKALERNDSLARSFSALKVEGGTVQRATFADRFGELVRELRLGEFHPPVKDKDGAARGAEPRPYVQNSSGMKLRRIPAGKFRMGSPPEERGRGPDETPHEVEITKPFFLGIYEVTQEDYEKVMGRNPSHFSAGGQGGKLVNQPQTKRRPVENVSWEDATEFCRKLSKLPQEQQAGRVYRLPTEAEWEYACRAGAPTAFGFGDGPQKLDAFAWFTANAGGTTHPVGEKQPNAWGLYDMHGNVREWCADRYSKDYYQESPRADPQGPPTDPLNFRVLRGGSWEDEAKNNRSADRQQSLPNFRSKLYGFRVVLETREKGP